MEERTGKGEGPRFQIELEEEGGTENGWRRESEIRIPCMVGGAYISVNNSRPTACIFLPDSFSLFPRSRKCDKIIRERFNFFPDLSGTFHDTSINYDRFVDRFLYLRIISITNIHLYP